MSYSGTSPEALLDRSDSKNPTTTCRGLNQNGRPCRRDVRNTQLSSPAEISLARRKDNNDSLLAILDSGDATALFCWQHKDQAVNFAARLRRQAETLSLKQKSSIDTLVERLGILDLEADGEADVETPSKQPRPRHSHGRKERSSLPTRPQHASRPAASLPAQDILNSRMRPSHHQRTQVQSRSRSKQKTSWSCCFSSATYESDDSPPPQQHLGRPRQHSSVENWQQPRTPAHRQSCSRPNMTQITSRPPQASCHLPLTKVPQFTPSHSHTHSPTQLQPQSQTQTLLSFIPPHLPPQTTSALLSELSKPLSHHDEAGYIYVFWLTPQHKSQSPATPTSASPRPNPQTISSLFPSMSPAPPNPPTSHPPPRILLKIGRAVNVHRRMTQWTKQCGHHLTLVRHYPRPPTSLSHPHPQPYSCPSPSSQTEAIANTAVKAPYIHRVERLIHLELAAWRVRDDRAGECASCGRVHREWFEVEGTREAVGVVDEVIARWVRWALQRSGTRW